MQRSDDAAGGEGGVSGLGLFARAVEAGLDDRIELRIYLLDALE
jgi:hypothetical protein